ncbi:MAG: hypothetical protein GY940_04360 [bacterium]|nr:hypothetical protein [bacterium]
MALKDALKKLNDAVNDLTSLHVQTFTGTLDLEVPAGGSGDFDTLRKTLKTAKESGTVTLVAESLIKFDGDSYNFVTKNSDDVPEEAFEVHQDAIRAGLETRQSLLALFKGIIKW